MFVIISYADRVNVMKVFFFIHCLTGDHMDDAWRNVCEEDAQYEREQLT